MRELSTESLDILRDLVERFDTLIQRRRVKLQRPHLYATEKRASIAHARSWGPRRKAARKWAKSARRGGVYWMRYDRNGQQQEDGRA